MVDWVSYDTPPWKDMLLHLKHKPYTNALDIGCSKGGLSKWMLENILTHPTSALHCIDNYNTNKDIFKDFQKNIQKYRYQVTVHDDHCEKVLRDFPREHIFDVICMNYALASVMEDAVLAYSLLKPGGIFVFQDYREKQIIDAFLMVYDDSYDLLYRDMQVVIKKKKSKQHE